MRKIAKICLLVYVFFSAMSSDKIFSQNVLFDSTQKTCKSAYSAIEKKQYYLALNYFNDCIQKDYNSTNLNNYYDRAKLYRDFSEFKKSTSDFLKILDRYPENTEILKYIGRNYFALTNWETAEEYFKKALNVTPNDTDIQNYLSLIDEKLSNEKKILAEFEENNTIYENTDAVSYIDFLTTWSKRLTNGEIDNVNVRILFRYLDRDYLVGETYENSKQYPQYYANPNKTLYIPEVNLSGIWFNENDPNKDILDKNNNKFMIINVNLNESSNGSIRPTLNNIIVIKDDKPKRYNSTIVKKSLYQDYEVGKRPMFLNKKEIAIQLSKLDFSELKNVRITIKVLINELGNVLKVQPLNVNHTFSDNEFEEIIFNCKFTPAENTGMAVRCWVQIPFDIK